MMVVLLPTLLERSTDRMGDGMNDIVKESALEVIRRAYSEGIYVQLSAGFRSISEQNALYVQGRRGIKGESVVTNAKGGQSYHNYGLAVDYFLLSDDGRTALWTVNDKWRRVAAIAKELGFEWGGDWTGFKDNPHLQMTGGMSITQLQKGQRPNLVSKLSKANVTESKPKEEANVEEKLNPSNGALREAVSAVLLWASDKNTFGNKAIDPSWRDKFNAGELTQSDADALKFLFAFRGMWKTLDEKGAANWETYFNKK